MSESFVSIVKSCEEKMRHGDLWKDFSVEELMDYARIKAKRALIFHKRKHMLKFDDDVKDAINILICALLREDLD